MKQGLRGGTLMHMSVLSGAFARKALPDWKRRELRAVAESKRNDYFKRVRSDAPAQRHA